MANTTEQALNKAIEALKPFAKAYEDWDGGSAAEYFGDACVPSEFRHALNALHALTAASAEAATPVAWMIEPNQQSHHALERELSFHRPLERSDWNVTPLYAAPQASQPIGQPVSEQERVNELTRAHQAGYVQGMKMGQAMAVDSQPVSGAVTDKATLPAMLAEMEKEYAFNGSIVLRGRIEQLRALISASGQAGQTEAQQSAKDAERIAALEKQNTEMLLALEWITENGPDDAWGLRARARDAIAKGQANEKGGAA